MASRWVIGIVETVPAWTPLLVVAVLLWSATRVLPIEWFAAAVIAVTVRELPLASVDAAIGTIVAYHNVIAALATAGTVGATGRVNRLDPVPLAYNLIGGARRCSDHDAVSEPSMPVTLSDHRSQGTQRLQ